MKTRLIMMTLTAGLLAYGCGNDNDDFVFNPTISPTATVTPPPAGTPQLSVVQRGILLRAVSGGELLFQSAAVTGTDLDFSSVVITSTVEEEAEFEATSGAVLSNGNKTATITLSNTDVSAVNAAVASLKAHATDSGVAVRAQTRVTFGTAASNLATNYFYTGNAGALALRVATDGEVTNLDTGAQVSAAGGFPDAVAAIQSVTPGNDEADTAGCGSLIFFEPGTHTSTAASADTNGYLVPDGDGDLNELLISGNNFFVSAAAPVQGVSDAPARAAESILSRGWDPANTGQVLLEIQASAVTVSGLELQVEQATTTTGRRRAVRFGPGGGQGSVVTSRLVVSNLGGADPTTDYIGAGDPSNYSTVAVESQQPSLNFNANFVNGFGLGLDVSSGSDNEVEDNAFVGNYISVAVEGVATKIAIVHNLFNGSGVAQTGATGQNRFGAHVYLGDNLVPDAIAFNNNDLYGQIPYDPSSSATPINGVFDFFTFTPQGSDVKIVQQGNYSPLGYFEDAVSGFFINNANYSPNISANSPKNYPNYSGL